MINKQNLQSSRDEYPLFPQIQTHYLNLRF